MVAEMLGGAELVPIVTGGDRGVGAADKSRWVAELEEALLEGRIDIAVHSAKDLPGERLAGPGAARRAGARRSRGCPLRQRRSRRPPERGARRDEQPAAPGAAAGGQSRPRASCRSAATSTPAWGAWPKAPTACSAIVLARAGLQRLGREPPRSGPSSTRPASSRLPARGRWPWRAAPTIESCREAIAAITDRAAFACLLAERALARELGADCDTPLGAHARPRAGRAPAAARLGGPPRRLGVGRRRALRRAGATPRSWAERSRAASRRSAPASCSRAHGRRFAVTAEPAGVGRVYLVGAGPGDPGLLTARALELIAVADVILYDRLVGPGALDGARADAELLFVGKEGGGEAVPQEQTEELMLERALSGKSVLRLKGGDPFVFGRGGEEALTLRAAGIPFEVVPGITSGIAAPAYAGIPVTHRGLATAVALVTGHTREDGEGTESAIDWPALAAFPGTLVFYMGVRRLPTIADSLIAAGRDAEEPVAVVQDGTLPGQRSVQGTLATIAEVVQREEIRPPSVTVVGAVAALGEEIAWLPPQAAARTDRGGDPRPARGERAGPQAPGARGRVSSRRRRSASQPLPGPPLDPSPYDLICVMSPNGVAEMFERLAAGEPPGTPARWPVRGSPRSAPAPARALAEHGILADVVPERSVAESLVEALEEIPVSRALVARAARGAGHHPRRAAGPRRRGGHPRAL